MGSKTRHLRPSLPPLLPPLTARLGRGTGVGRGWRQAGSPAGRFYCSAYQLRVHRLLTHIQNVRQSLR